MTSDRLDRFSRVLTYAAGERPTGREVAELLWLARQMEAPAAADSAETEPAGEPPEPRPQESPEPPPADGPAPQVAAAADRVPLHAPADDRPAQGDGPRAPAPREHVAEQPEGSDDGYAPLLAPAPPMLARPLALQRAVRPLRRTVPSAHGWELDETETAHRIAALGARREMWLPVLRPRRERWLHLRFVLDSGPTMTMWRPLLRDLRTALAQTGAFRTVDAVALGANGEVPHAHWERGRTAVLIISDCMGPQWREGTAGRRWYRTLRSWANELPVAVVQPLPERLWQHTAFAPTAGMLSAPGPGAANSALNFVPYEKGLGSAGVPVPVLEASPAWFGNWASLVASSGATQVPGAAARALPRPPQAFDEDGLDPDRVGPEELVLRFRSLASPQAFRLAAHLAVGSAHLPVMRLVQAAIEEHPEPQHLAEVVLSGMLRTLPGAVAGAYAFRPGVREVLLGTLPRTALAATTRLLGRVSAQIDSLAGAVPGEFHALVAGRGGPVGAPLGDPFALVSRESVQLLRGPQPAAGGEREEGPGLLGHGYELQQLIGSGTVGEVWRGHDRFLKRPVAVKRYPFVDGVPPAARSSIGQVFTARAHGMVNSDSLHSPRLAAVYDGFAQDDACYLVMELVEGGTLRELLAQNPSGLGADRVGTWGRDLLAGIEALHAAGIVHGDVKPENILISPDRGPVLCDYGVEWSSASPSRNPDGTLTEVRREDVVRTAISLGLPGTPRYLAPERITTGSTDRAIDLYSLGCVLYEMLTGVCAFPGDQLPAVLRAHLDAGFETLTPRVAGLPDIPGRAILDLLGRSPERRRRGADLLRAPTRQNPGPPSDERRPRYRVLGSPMVESVLSVPPEYRSVLARLLLERGVPVPAAQLRLLSEEARVSLEATIDHLQSLGHPLHTTGDDVVLKLDGAELDLLEAEQHVEDAETARQAGDLASAGGHLEYALSLWNDVPLAEVPGDWAWEQRQQLVSWHGSLTRSRDELLRAPARDPSSASLVLELAPPPDNGVAHQLYAEALRTAAGRFFGDVPTFHHGELGGRTSSVVRLEIGDHRSRSDVVAWVVETLPLDLSELMPEGSGTAWLRVLVMEWESMFADRLPTVQSEPLAALTVAVELSEAVFAALEPEQQQGFAAVYRSRSDKGTTPAGRRRILTVPRG